MFTATFSGSGHVAASRQAACSTHSPIWMIKPPSSAIGMKSAGETNPTGRAVPTQQCLESRDAGIFQVDQRLKIQFEFIARYGGAQVPLQFSARLHQRVHFGFEVAEAVAAITFGLIQRDVGALEQNVGSELSPGAIAMPTLAPMMIWCPATSNGVLNSRKRRVARAVAAAG